MKPEPPFKTRDRIRLIKMGEDPYPIEPGTEGTIVAISGWPNGRFQIAVAWDVPRSLSLVWPIDQFEVISDDTSTS